MAAVLGRDGRQLLEDAVVVLAVAGLLAGIHWLLPPGSREGLVLHYDDPDPLHALTAAYVHLDDAHLRGNLVAFLLASTFAGLLASLADARRWFRFATLGYLTVLPMAIGMTAATVVGGDVVGRGFSGVVAGYVGFVLASPGVVLHRALGYERWVGWNAVAALIVVTGADILWVVRGGLAPTIGVALAAGLLLVLGPFARAAVDRSNWPADRAAWADLAGAVVLLGAVLAVVSLFVVGLFPADLVRGDSVTNILGHYLGLVYGAVIAVWGSRYWTGQ